MAKFDYLKLCTYKIKPSQNFTVNYFTALFPSSWRKILSSLQPPSQNGYVSLPIQSFNSLIQTYTEVIYISPVGKNFYTEPWLYCQNPINNEILITLLSDWILGAFKKASEEEKANGIAALKTSDIQWKEAILNLSQWSKEENCTAKYSNSAFFLFPNYLVNKLTGKTLDIKTKDGEKKITFYRTIKPSADGTELISEPLDYTYTTAKSEKTNIDLYSIVISFSIQTFAWVDYPVINCDFWIRTWLTKPSRLKKDYDSSVYLKINSPWIQDRKNTCFTVTKIKTYSEKIQVEDKEDIVWHNRWTSRLSSTLKQTGLVQLPENAKDVVNDPLKFKDQFLVVYKNGIKPNSKINPGLTPGDRRALLDSISQELTELELFPRIERVKYSISKKSNNPILNLIEVINKLEKSNNKTEENIEKLVQEKQSLQQQVIELIKTRLGEQKIKVHIWYQEESAKERIITYLSEFINSSLVEISSEFLGELRTPLPINKKNQAIKAIQQRAEKLNSKIEATKKPAIAYIELQGAASFNPSYKDVKPALRWGHGRLGWKSQFLVPEIELGNVEHRTKAAVLDGLRQLLLLPPTSDLTLTLENQDSKTKEKCNLNDYHYAALWVIQRNKTNKMNLKKKTEYLPLFIYLPAQLTLASEVKVFAPGLKEWCPYSDIFELLATGEAYGYTERDSVSNFINQTFSNQILPLAKDKNIIFFAHRQNSRRFWSNLANKNITKDTIKLNQTDTPITITEYPGLRIIGLRDRTRSETPQYFAEREKDDAIGYSKGLWKITDHIFYSTAQTSNTQKFNRHLSKLTTWVNSKGKTQPPSPTENISMPNILEITVAFRQLEDNPEALAALTHEMRYDCINYDGALSFPTIVHLLKQIEEYSILNERL